MQLFVVTISTKEEDNEGQRELGQLIPFSIILSLISSMPFESTYLSSGSMLGGSWIVKRTLSKPTL